MAIAPQTVFDALQGAGLRFFTGVPDSLLKDFCAYVTDHAPAREHVITANEGNAVALAAGRYLGTGEPAVVYLQNSGTGNAVNPLLSLADRQVYALPMLLVIGWRGEPGVADEPQHIKQGRVQTALLDAMEIPWQVLDAHTADAAAVIERALAQMHERSAPVALLVRKGAFEKYRLQSTAATDSALSREQVIGSIVECLDEQDIVVSTTGMTSRELYEWRRARGEAAGRDFLTVGSMGHTLSIAQGVAQGQRQRRVVCLDGDGSAIMHLGSLAVLAHHGPGNLVHVVLNNGAHDSVGGQPTVGQEMDWPGLARACGYAYARRVEPGAGPQEAVKEAMRVDAGPSFVEVPVRCGARADLGRPQETPVQNRDAFMQRWC